MPTEERGKREKDRERMSLHAVQKKRANRNLEYSLKNHPGYRKAAEGGGGGNW